MDLSAFVFREAQYELLYGFAFAKAKESEITNKQTSTAILFRPAKISFKPFINLSLV